MELVFVFPESRVNSRHPVMAGVGMTDADRLTTFTGRPAPMTKPISITALLACLLGCGLFGCELRAELRAGAATVDVTPIQFPVLVNGGMTSRTADQVASRLYARAVVVADDDDRVAIVVVDSCMMPRPLLDEAKQLAAQRTKLRADRILISATHTHTAPASMGCLGTDADPTYAPYLREKLAEAVAVAEANLQPARVGFAVANAADYTAVRRWILRPDRLRDDPFGNPTVRANMHAGRVWDDVTGESGPEDPDLTLMAWQTLEGHPIAVLANFSMHYYSGVPALHADYFGLFCQGLEERLNAPEKGQISLKDSSSPAPDAPNPTPANRGAADPATSPTKPAGRPPFVALMSHGCSGDIWRRDYKVPDSQVVPDNIERYTNGLLDIAMNAYRLIEYQSDADLKMAERRFELRYRVPDKQRLQWAQQIVAAMGDRLPKTQEEVYAREQVILHARQSTEVVIQAIRIGDFAIASTPNETYALTGLKIKLQSPSARTMVVELANGGDGYIPPPEQHGLGGYNTWAARSAGLEVNAEPRITETALELLEQVCTQPRRVYQQSKGAGVDTLLATKPLAYYRMDEFAAPIARDHTGQDHHAFYEPGVAFFLDGPHSARFCLSGETNRAAHFAGGRLQTRFSQLADTYSLSLWFWNGMPNAGRETAGWIASRGHHFGLDAHSEHLGVGGTSSEPGKLVWLRGRDAEENRPVVGRTMIERWTWNHLVLVREPNRARVYLNGQVEPEIDLPISSSAITSGTPLFLGGRSDNQANWEGRLDEIAVFDRPLTIEEIRKLAE
jgi:hypothetical protein